MEENKKPENPSAFPREDYQGDNYKMGQGGMTLRDYFAAKAMLGILNNGLTIRDVNKTIEAYDAVTYNAYLLADAMLKQREL